MSDTNRSLSHARSSAMRGTERLEKLGMSDLKRAVLSAAGYTPETMAAFLQQATSAMVDALAAEKVQRFAFKGEVIETHTDADHATRLKAAAELAALVTDMADLKGSERKEAGHGGTSITLNVPFLAQLSKESEPIDVSPER